MKNDLFLNYISHENGCAFCDECEDAEHYFFNCSRYQSQRYQLFNTLRHLHSLSCHLLLRGGIDLPEETNISIFDTVHEYIAATGRFSSNYLRIYGYIRVKIVLRYPFHLHFISLFICLLSLSLSYFVPLIFSLFI